MNTVNLFDLTGKTALVTGCNRGIGKAMAEALAEAGADIIGVASSEFKEGSETALAIRQAGRKFYPYQTDLSDREKLYQFINQVKRDHAAIDILVNNAGIILREPAAVHPDEYWDKVLNINLDAPFILARELGREMIARGSGKIIFTASLLTLQGGINVPGYTASKSAIGGLVKALANEWAGKGVNVNAIAPGYINTDVSQLINSKKIQQVAASYANQI